MRALHQYVLWLQSTPDQRIAMIPSGRPPVANASKVGVDKLVVVRAHVVENAARLGELQWAGRGCLVLAVLDAVQCIVGQFEVAPGEREDVAELDQIVVQQLRRLPRRRADLCKLTPYPHTEQEFWLWVSNWAVFVQYPSDLSHSDEGYVLPELDVRYHQVPSDYATPGHQRDGQALMFTGPPLGLSAAAREKNGSFGRRVGQVVEIVDGYILEPVGRRQLDVVDVEERARQERPDPGRHAGRWQSDLHATAQRQGRRGFKNWITMPLVTAKAKESQLVRPLGQLWSNDNGIGQRMYVPDAKGLGGVLTNAGRTAKLFAAPMVPTDAIHAALDWKNGKAGDVDKLKVAGPLAGLTFSKGPPSGPEVSAMYDPATDSSERRWT